MPRGFFRSGLPGLHLSDSPFGPSRRRVGYWCYVPPPPRPRIRSAAAAATFPVALWGVGWVSPYHISPGNGNRTGGLLGAKRSPCQLDQCIVQVVININLKKLKLYLCIGSKNISFMKNYFWFYEHLDSHPVIWAVWSGYISLDTIVPSGHSWTRYHQADTMSSNCLPDIPRTPLVSPDSIL